MLFKNATPISGQQMQNQFNQPTSTNINSTQQQYSQQNNSNLTFHHSVTIASKFGIQFHLISEDKIGRDNKKYMKWSIMITIIPPGDQPMTYDSSKSFNMKTSVQNVAAFVGALYAAYYGQFVDYSIFTDSSKSQYTNTNSMKVLSINSTNENNRLIIQISAMQKTDKNIDVTTGVRLSKYDAYGWAKILEKFVDICNEIIIKNSNNS